MKYRGRHAGFDATAQREGADRVRPGVDHRREAVARHHVLELPRQRILGQLASVHPLGLGEVDVAVPETRCHRLSGGVDDALGRRCGALGSVSTSTILPSRTTIVPRAIAGWRRAPVDARAGDDELSRWRLRLLRRGAAGGRDERDRSTADALTTPRRAGAKPTQAHATSRP